MVAPHPHIVIPEALLASCPDLPDAQDGRLSTLMHNQVDVTHAYHVCARRHADLSIVVRDAIGQGDSR